MISFKEYFVKLDEDYKTVSKKFVDAGTDVNVVSDHIARFKKLSDNQRLSGPEKNIDSWSNKSFNEFKQFITNIESKVTKSGQKKNSGTSVDITTPEQKAAGWNIIIPTNIEASCYHGKGTDWCVSSRSKNYFTQYFLNNDITLIFCLNDKKEKWAIACNSGLKEKPEFFNANDDSITKTKFNSQTKLKADEIMKLALGHEQVKVDRKTGQENSIEYRIKHTTHPDPELEKKIIDSKDAYNYAYNVLKGPFKAGEEVISKDAEYAYNYADEVLRDNNPSTWAARYNKTHK